jgi:hypothetical protein
MKIIFFSLTFIVSLLFLPDSVSAQSFVPCDGLECNACHLVEMGNTILVWLIGVMFVVFAVILAAAGWGLVTSAGNQTALSDAKSKFTNALIGLIIVLGAWLLVDTIMKGLLGGNGDISGYGPWSQIKCVTPEATKYVYNPVSNASRGIAYAPASGALSPAQTAAIAALSAPDADLAGAAAAAGLDAQQTRNLQALMRVESGGCRNKVSPVGALGCMQIMPETARSYDSSLQDLSDAQVRDKLLNDDTYNMQLGAEIYADLYTKYDEDETLVYAAYNGGPGSNEPSSDCPGLRKWECEWDSPGCYETENTSCTPNTGYIETRNYVQKIPSVANQLR